MRRLTADELQDLVARREAGATWKDIGRAYGMQDERAKHLYEKQKQRRAGGLPPGAPI